MDMRRHLNRWLNDTALRELDDRYEGRIANVGEEMIRNRFTSERQLQPVISFEDGWRLVPNISQRRQLIEFFGPETNDWIGERMVVYRTRVEKKDPKSGLMRESWEKRVAQPSSVPISIRRKA